jgi:hypothetical protein
MPSASATTKNSTARTVVARDSTVRLVPTETWQTAEVPLRYPEYFAVDENFYVVARRAD